MAGIGAILSYLSEGKWPRCHDGRLLEPLDILFLLYKNKGRNATAINFCYVADRFNFPPLRNLLPDPTASFTPDDFVDCLVCLFITSLFVVVGMALVKHLWERVDHHFAAIKPSHKKWYVVANLSKSFFLCCMAVSPRYWEGTYDAYIHQRIEGINMKRCGMMYVATDLVALFMVPKLPLSTVLHHITTILLILIVSTVNINVEGFSGLLGVCKMVLLYGVFSTIPYLVNTYLALRVVYSKDSWLHLVVKISLWPYVLCCVCNWTVHLIWAGFLLYNIDLSVPNILYLLAISTMVNDDIVLIKWLIRKSSPV